MIKPQGLDWNGSSFDIDRYLDTDTDIRASIALKFFLHFSAIQIFSQEQNAHLSSIM